jgi:hypothetical protein
MEGVAASPLLALSLEVLDVALLPFLDVRSLARLAQTCKDMRAAAKGSLHVESHQGRPFLPSSDGTHGTLATVLLGSLIIETEDDLYAMRRLRLVVGNVSFATNWDGSGLACLHNLEEVTGYVDFAQCSRLTSAAGLEALSRVGGSLVFLGCRALRSTAGLTALTTVGNSLSFCDCIVLESVAGLGALTTIGRHLLFTNCIALRSTAGLSALTAVGGSLSLKGCSAPESIVGLQSLLTACSEPFDGVLLITGNATRYS